MKVVFLHTDFRLYWPDRLTALQKALQEKGNELIVIEIAGKGTPYLFDKGSNCAEWDWWHCLYPDKKMEDLNLRKACRAIIKKLNEIQPDIVFSGGIAFASGAAAVNWCRSNKKPLAIFDDVRVDDVPRSRFTNFIKKTVYSGADAVFIPAPSHDRDFTFWGFKQNEIFYGVNVVDSKKWQSLIPDSETLNKFKEEKALPDRFILGVGRQVFKKNWAGLLEAFYEENNTKELTYSLVLVGNGPERERLVPLINRNDDNKIKFFDFLPPEQLAKFYALAEAVVLPSCVSEPWGLVINEAMACGKPVLVSKQCGCCKTLVREGKTGFSFDARGQGELRKALRELSDLSIEELNAMGKNAQKIIADWDLDRFTQGVNKAIKGLTQKPAKGFKNILDKAIIKLWKGRYRPT